jgi:phage tail sheath protein FI
MATYLRPGVFIEETLLPLTDSAASTSDSIAAFVGTSSKGGPLGPTLVTSWSQYVALFGDSGSETDDLGYAVFTFFNNGGAQCYVVRAAAANATKATETLLDSGDLAGESGTAADVLDVTAKAPGDWASNEDSGTAVYVTVDAATSGRFDLTIEVGQGTTLVSRETFVDLTLDPTDARNAIAIVNSLTVGSKYVTLSLNAAQASKVFGTDYGNPDTVSKVLLGSTGTPGTNGAGTIDFTTATKTLGQVDANLAVNIPAVTDTTVLTDVVTWAESVGNVFVVVDGPKPGPTDTPSTIATALGTLAAALPASSYVAVYGPWLYVQDRKVTGALRLTAPGGAVLGQYARTDVTRGVQKAPAGTGTTLRGVQAVAARFDNTTLDTLNTKQVNVIRTVPGAGICIMGSRTLNPGMPDRYINIRRSLMFLERDLVNLTQYAVFETNDSDTWDGLSAVVSQYLTTQWQVGVLQGDTPEAAFFVVCDDTNNDAASVNSGVVNIQVGVALNSPAEFIVIKIGQFDGGATVTTDETV